MADRLPVDPNAASYLPDYAEAGSTAAGAGAYSYSTGYPGGGLSGQDAADRLQGIIERGRSWPIWSADRVGGIDTGTFAQMGTYGQSLREIALWTALRENDRSAIIEHTNWERDRPIHLDPIPERISTAYSDLLYGEEPTFIAGSPDDQETMDEMTGEVALGGELKRWTDICVSEGEVWWRAWTDLEASDWPLVSGHSRMNVIPLFVGRKIVAAAFVDNLLNQEIYIEGQVHVIFWRHIEIHTVGYVRNLLYRGSVGGLGDRQDLSQLPETAHLDEDWDHGLPVMLAGRIPNKLGRDFRLGVSEYQGVRDLIMDLNEARTIQAENARLVLKARMVVPANAVDADGNFDAAQDVVVAESLDEELAGKQGGPYAVLEYNFRAEQLIQHKNELTLDVMARCGLAEQYVQESRGGGGQAFTGTALRTRLIPTIQAAQGKARNFDKEAPRILKSLALLSSLPPEQGGCGQDWKEPEGPHIQQRSPLLPEDLNEKVQRHVMAVQGEVESIQTAIEDMHGDEWDDERVELEVARIRADRSSGPTYADDQSDPKDLESLDIPNVPPGGPGSAVPGPSDMLGSAQPGADQPPVDGQSPGKQPPQVVAGGPR